MGATEEIKKAEEALKVNEQFVDPYPGMTADEKLSRILAYTEAMARRMQSLTRVMGDFIDQHQTTQPTATGTSGTPIKGTERSGDSYPPSTTASKVTQVLPDATRKVDTVNGKTQVYLKFSKDPSTFPQRMRALEDAFGKANVRYVPFNRDDKTGGYVEVNGS
jgi:hypothetical protein